MGNTPAILLVWGIRLGVVATSIFAFIVVLNLAFQLLFVTLNQNVLSDLFAMIQMWLPFNLNVVLSWFVTALIAYSFYRLSKVAYQYLDDLIKI